VGESHRLGSADWLDAAAIHEFLLELPQAAASGDIYARLVADGNGAV